MYIVTEIQTNADGSVGVLNTQHNTRAEAESKYYNVLSYAAVSSVRVHAAALMTNEGFPLMNQSYQHPVQPEPEPVEEDGDSEA